MYLLNIRWYQDNNSNLTHAIVYVMIYRLLFRAIVIMAMYFSVKKNSAVLASKFCKKVKNVRLSLYVELLLH